MGLFRNRGIIFISYRREDTAATAGRLDDHLTGRFGKDRVFMDVDSIAIGHDFTKALVEAVSRCSILLVLIGRGWISATGDEGRRKIEDPDDWVRVEVETALNRGIQVVPVLVDGATLPQASDLPSSLHPFILRQTFSLNNTAFKSDVENLITAMTKMLKAMPGRSAEAPRIASRSSVTKQGEWQLELITDKRFEKAFRLSSNTEVHQITVNFNPIIESIKVDGKFAVWSPSHIHAKQYHLTRLSSTLGCTVTIMVWFNRFLDMNGLTLRMDNQILTWSSRPA
jgi:hypothetical protein